MCCFLFFFFFNDTATTEIYTLSLHDALPIWLEPRGFCVERDHEHVLDAGFLDELQPDRKSTRLNSSHGYISYAVFCLKKKTNERPPESRRTRIPPPYPPLPPSPTRELNYIIF